MHAENVSRSGTPTLLMQSSWKPHVKEIIQDIE